MNQISLSTLLKVSAILWIIWGVFHLLIGVVFILILQSGHPSGPFESIPALLDITMFGNDSPFPPLASLKQHAFNLAWIGAVVTVASFYVWKKHTIAIFTCILLGGLADLGYFVFVDLPGYASSPGPEMTYIMATAIVLALFVYFRSDKLNALHKHAQSQAI